ncbi:SLBB domain-containing protein [Kangiella koreensis]|uniref:Polysaccharide export protein n=1 Tax=Kangiella koreensis (strain DSM 16069 / JCM 12317 / KCTC 12182 / SW-125) TaxID=523791 RepID=C7RAP3_KANKD|nr:SLBB domain-containing protein [Kangiella koreensis]ACV26335.1 polysaccharide export protein [Kangiella koreensis DSM 16069]
MNKLLGISFRLVLCLGALLTQVSIAAQDLSQAKQLCENASAQQREMARAAGYDVDALCASLKSQSSQDSKTTSSASSILPRELDNFPIGAEQHHLEDEIESNKPRIEQKLEPFGYDIFAGLPTTYTPVTDLPVPSNYVVGPGDVIQVQLYGKENNSYELVVSRNGSIQFPQLGPINVAGLSYTELKESLTQQINEQFIGVKSNISLGELRSIQVFVLGESYKPGAYTVSSLSTVMNALYVSGGIKEVGSLRNIQLKRNGQLISSIDLYDFLLKGDIRADRRLQSGDVIFIPSVNKTASIAGEVVRPAIYEIKNEKSISELVDLAGGFLPSAYTQDVRIERIDNENQKTALDIDLTTKAGRLTTLKAGDFLKVYPVAEKNENIVELSGHVERPGTLAWKKGLRLADVISNAKQLKLNANIDAVIIAREVTPLGELKVHHASLRAAWKNYDSFDNILLEPRDRIIILANSITEKEVDIYKKESREKKYLDAVESQKFDVSRLNAGRSLTYETGVPSNNIEPLDNEVGSEYLTKDKALLNGEKQLKPEIEEYELLELEIRNQEVEKLVKELKSQSTYENPARVVRVDGAVKFPGEYPLTETMSSADLINIAGGLSESAYIVEAEITRQEIIGNETAKITHLPVELQSEFLGNRSSTLKAKDQLSVKITPEYRNETFVEVQGEVRFPGRYKVARGETLTQLIERVGGFSDFAHIKATVFSRKELREHEQKQLDQLQDKLRQSIATIELEQSNIGKTADVSSAKSLIDILDTTEATGRLVINLDGILAGKIEDVVLKDGDMLIVPSYRQEVTVVGEVQVATSHLYNPNFDFEDYIDRSGGEKDTANSDAIYIVKADGSVILPNRSSWLTHSDAKIESGDTIVVPLDTTRVDSLELWSRVSQIVYQLALGAAAVNSF